MTAPAPSFDDLYQLALAELVFRRPDLQVIEGDVTDAMLCGVAAAGDCDIRQSAIEFARTFLDTSEGEDLHKLADDRYGLQWIEATPAIGQVTIQRTGGGSAETFPVGTRVATVADASGEQVVVQLTAPAVFAGGANGPITVAVEAVEAGRDGNVAASTLVEWIDEPTDPLFTVTNAATLAGGADEESDEALRQRCRSFFSTLRRGTLAALEFGAKQVPQVRVASATESDSGLVTIYVSDADGNSNAEMINAVILELVTWKAGGSVVQVLGGVIFEQDVTLSITARSGVSVDPTTVIAAVTAALYKLKAGETLYLTAIRSAVKGIDPDGITEVTVTVPTANVAPTAQQLIRAGTVTIV